MDFPLLARFHRCRWSRTRRRMDAMKHGQVLRLPLHQYFNANAIAARLTEAYAGTRVWKVRRVAGKLSVRHVVVRTTN